MRLLSIGHPLPNVEIDNYTPFSAPSYHDYDVLLVDPESITRQVKELVSGGSFDAFDGRPVVNAPSSAEAVSGAELLKRRFDETQRFLEGGGLVVVVARPNAVQPGLLGFEGCDRYSWLPAPAGISWNSPLIRPADGKTVRVTAEGNSFAPLLREYRGQVRFRAVFDDRQGPFRENATVIATGGAGVPIAAEFRVLGGTVLFLPAFADDVTHNRSEVAQAIVDAARQRMHVLPAEAPYYVQTMAVPGLAEVERELGEVERAMLELTRKSEAARERQNELASHRDLVWQDGAAYRAAVSRALVLLGFAPMSQPGEPIEMEADGALVYIEAESSRGEVVEWPYIRLQRRLEERLLKRGDQLKGIVIANGYRESQAEYRQQQYTDALRIACENYRYCLVTADTLFDLSMAVVKGASDEEIGGMRRRILRTSGLLDRERALGTAAEDGTASGVF